MVDEYGGVSGLVTLEDILEHLFEEAYGDDEPANCGCDILDENTMIVPGKMSMEQLNDLLQASLPQDEFDTIGGFVLHLFGKMPERGEIIHFENYHFRIESIGRTRILKIRIEKEKQSRSRRRKHEPLSDYCRHIYLPDSGGPLFRRRGCFIFLRHQQNKILRAQRIVRRHAGCQIKGTSRMVYLHRAHRHESGDYYRLHTGHRSFD